MNNMDILIASSTSTESEFDAGDDAACVCVRKAFLDAVAIGVENVHPVWVWMFGRSGGPRFRRMAHGLLPSVNVVDLLHQFLERLGVDRLLVLVVDHNFFVVLAVFKPDVPAEVPG